MKKTIGVVGALTLGLGMVLAAPGAATAVESGTLYVPDDLDFSSTGATGRYEVTDDGGLRVWTQSNTSTDKVAGYAATSVPLADVGEVGLDLTNTAGTIAPGYQLVVDFGGETDLDQTRDGILVGEPNAYGMDWWLSNSAESFVKAGAPTTGAGSGGPWHGTLEDWLNRFPDANVVAFGFSLGSGVYGDWEIDAIHFAGTRYTFAEHVVLSSKEDCKNGGWATSTKPTFKNQGDCVSSFASQKSTKAKLSAFAI